MIEKVDRKEINGLLNKLINFLKGKFVLGIVLGAVSSVLVNAFAVEYERYTIKIQVRDSIYAELLEARHRLMLGDEKNAWVRDFDTLAWEGGLASGYVAKFSTKTKDQLIETYWYINRSNRMRDYYDEFNYKLLLEAIVENGLGNYYKNKGEEYIKSKQEEEATDAFEKALSYMESSEANAEAETYLSDTHFGFVIDNNASLLTRVDDTLLTLQSEKIDNPLSKFIVYFSLSAICVFLLLVLFFWKSLIRLMKIIIQKLTKLLTKQSG